VTGSLSHQSTRKEVEDAVRSAFAGVRLGRGVSLTIAELIDEGADPATIDSLLGTEPDEDWASIPVEELERAEAIAHLDAEGLRFYLPALMSHLLDDYQPTAMWSIGTIAALDQRARHPRGFLELLSKKQREAIAIYVRALPELVELRYEDSTRVSRALQDVWADDLPAER
jgi:hypothetical protein